MLKLSKLEANKGQIEGLPKNPRIIKDDKFRKLVKSIEDNPEMTSLREILVYPYGDKFVVIGGNMRLKAMKELGYKEAPCKIIPEETTVEQLKAYTIKDNSGFGEWDFDMLMGEWDLNLLEDCAIEMPDVDSDAPVIEESEAEEDDFDEENDEVERRVKKGDIWRLGEHRLMCGDSTSADDVARLMNGERADLCFTDPPYGMKKESEGVLNDNLNYNDLLELNKRWIPLTFANLKDNGSWYCWGIDEPLMDIYSNILRPMQKQGRITFRNLITWDKGSAQGMKCESGMMYAVADEKCLFVMCGIQDNKMRNTEIFNERFESIRNYFREEKKKSGLSTEDLSRIDSTRVSHYWAIVQFEFPTKEAYEKIQSYCELNHIQAFKARYEDLRQEYERIANRAYFDNTHDNMNNVWHFDRTSKEERDGIDHATPKPLALCARGIKTSSREGETVLDVFGGSGSTMIACEQLNRQCRMMELAPHYCDVIIARWEKLTGKKAVKIN